MTKKGYQRFEHLLKEKQISRKIHGEGDVEEKHKTCTNIVEKQIAKVETRVKKKNLTEDIKVGSHDPFWILLYFWHCFSS